MAPSKAKNQLNQKSKKALVQRESAGSQGKAAEAQGFDGSVPVELQQLLLNIFKNAFSGRFESNIHPLLQEVKGHLFNRDFLQAFGRDDYLQVYAARWSSSRALGYLQVFAGIDHQISSVSDDGSKEQCHRKVVCLGGGAGAEVAALGGYLSTRTDEGSSTQLKLEIVAIDIANWTTVMDNIHHNIIAAPPLSRYASAAVKAANKPLVNSDDFSVTFHQYDLLTTDFPVISNILGDSNLITLMFTLNELYSTSISLTQKFLLDLTSCLSDGAFLLVIDSPGSYSTVNLNGAKKQYPMQWLLDHTLLRNSGKGETPAWTKVEEDESRWFRLPKSLEYPIDLENMRYQLHLYKKGY